MNTFYSTVSHRPCVLFARWQDFVVDADAAGRWLLDAIGDVVAEHGVREVHRKLVVLGLQGESPPGFTAALLVDESHVTAHCYSDRGWCAALL